MDGSVELTADECKMLLKAHRSGDDSQTSRRAHIVLLRADGLTWEQIRRCLYCSNDLIAGTLQSWAAGGVTAIVDTARAAAPRTFFIALRHENSTTGFPRAQTS